MAVNVPASVAPTARLASGPPETVTFGSFTETFVSVTLPVFLTVKL